MHDKCNALESSVNHSPHLPPITEKLISHKTGLWDQKDWAIPSNYWAGDEGRWQMGCLPSDGVLLQWWSQGLRHFKPDKVLCTTTDLAPNAVTLVCVRTSPLKVGQDLGVESLVLGAATHILIKSSFECGAIHTIAIKLKCHRLFFNSFYKHFVFTVPKLEFQEISL